MIIFSTVDHCNTLEHLVVRNGYAGMRHILEIYADRYSWVPNPPEQWRTVQKYLLHTLSLRHGDWVNRMFTCLLSLNDSGWNIQAKLCDVLKHHVYKQTSNWRGDYDVYCLSISLNYLHFMYVYSIHKPHNGWLCVNYDPGCIVQAIDNLPLSLNRYFDIRWHARHMGMWKYGQPSFANWLMMSNQSTANQTAILYQIVDWAVYEHMLGACEKVYSLNLDFVRQHARNMPVRPIPMVLSARWALCMKIYRHNAGDVYDLYFLLNDGVVIPYRQTRPFFSEIALNYQEFADEYNRYRDGQTTLEAVSCFTRIPQEILLLLDSTATDRQAYVDLTVL